MQVLRNEDGIVSPEINTWEISFTMKDYVAPQRWKAYANMPNNIYDRPVLFKARDLLAALFKEKKIKINSILEVEKKWR